MIVFIQNFRITVLLMIFLYKTATLVENNQSLTCLRRTLTSSPSCDSCFFYPRSLPTNDEGHGRKQRRLRRLEGREQGLQRSRTSRTSTSRGALVQDKVHSCTSFCIGRFPCSSHFLGSKIGKPDFYQLQDDPSLSINKFVRRIMVYESQRMASEYFFLMTLFLHNWQVR